MKSVLFLFFLSICSAALGQQKLGKGTQHINTNNGVAIGGYDPVSYFALQKAMKGNPKIWSQNKGIIYYFSSEANKKVFQENPQKFEPQYGGWCAYAIADHGKKVEINPETFKIIRGKLYLFYNANLNNTLKKWNKDEENLMALADRYWSKLIQ